MTTFNGTNGDDILPPEGSDTSGDDSFFGFGGNDTASGGAGNDSFDMGSGNDVVFAGDGDDNLSGGADNDTLYGGAGVDYMDGGGGDDILDGGTGADTMVGNFGDDTYYVDNANDVVTEISIGDGTDQVFSSVSYALSQFVENLTLTGTKNLNTNGNDLNNQLVGNSGNNVIDGMAGADVMIGGAGNDTYRVDNSGDSVVEAANGGTDQIFSSVSYALSQFVENLTLTGTKNLNTNGNALNNQLVGNSGNNVIDGMAGADVMSGGAGNDTYRVDNAGDSMVEAANGGTDQVFSSVSYALSQFVENLTLTGTKNLNTNGNALGNTLVGNSGNNVIDGMAGADVMTGGGGSDTFAFTSSLVAGNIDTITDFSAGADKIRLNHTIFNAIVGTGTLSADQFAANASGTAQDANDRIIYETDTGKLFYDSNGSAAGGAVQFAKLSPGLALTANDFSIA
jgi:Ca2+-binding RTX toxin-like protein